MYKNVQCYIFLVCGVNFLHFFFLIKTVQEKIAFFVFYPHPAIRVSRLHSSIVVEDLHRTIGVFSSLEKHVASDTIPTRFIKQF